MDQYEIVYQVHVSTPTLAASSTLSAAYHGWTSSLMSGAGGHPTWVVEAMCLVGFSR